MLNERNGLYDPGDEVIVGIGIGLTVFEQNMNFFDNVKSRVSVGVREIGVDDVVVVSVVVVLAVVVRPAVSVGGV